MSPTSRLRPEKRFNVLGTCRIDLAIHLLFLWTLYPLRLFNLVFFPLVSTNHTGNGFSGRSSSRGDYSGGSFGA